MEAALNAHTDFAQLAVSLDLRQERKADAVIATAPISDKEKAVIYAEMAKAVNRYAGTLTDDRYKVDVLRFISDRTFGFQKLSEEIPGRHFLGGVKNTCAGLGMSAAKLYDCLRWWRAEGVVVTMKFRRKVRYAIKRERVLALVSPKTRDKIAPVLTLMDDKWGPEEPREYLHAVEVSKAGYLHEVEVHSKNHSPYRTREETKRSAPKVAPDADRGASPFSAEEKRASAPIEPSQAAAPAVAVQAAPPVPTHAVPPAAKTAPIAKRGRVSRELWARTLVDRFDTAFREFWPDAPMPAAPSGKLRGQWEHFARSWRRPDISVADWIAWAVENWRAVYVTVFRHVEYRQEEDARKLANTPWVPKSHWRARMECPEYPDLGFLFAYKAEFQKGYDRRASQKIRAGLTREDRLVHQLMYRGYSHADALAEAHEIMAKDKKREDLEARAREINDAARRLEREKQMPEYRRAVARVRSEMYLESASVKPVVPKKHPLKPDFSHAHEEGKPLPPFPVWRDDPEEACAP
jgi:hypothetical protein